ncbi:MAG: hypothetical protein OXH52_18805 [Gammaproteobacteria bacterium]|nr:hypothetical protein [Gammaproteobacteria bacterium]
MVLRSGERARDARLSLLSGARRGGAAAGGGFGVESVVSTYRYRYVDVFVSLRIVFGGIYGGGDGVLDGWRDFMDPFVELYYEHIDREDSMQVTRRVPVAGVPNISGRDMRGELERELRRLAARGILDSKNSYGSADEQPERYWIFSLRFRQNTGSSWAGTYMKSKAELSGAPAEC